MIDRSRSFGEDWPSPKLFADWAIFDPPAEPSPPSWPEPLDGYSTRQRELWGVQQVMRALFEEADGARILHRGDSPVWKDGDLSDWSHFVVGDLDVSYSGRSPIFEVKAYLPAVRVRYHGRFAPPLQGLDRPRRQDYLNEQTRSGRPFYVVWAWPESGGTAIAGERIDRLAWPAPYEAPNRRRSVKGAKTDYWPIAWLRGIRELVADLEGWSGAPYQEALALA